MTDPTLAVYKNGAVDVPHMGVSLRKVFGAAAVHHDVGKKGRLVPVTLNGVYIGTIQLMDHPPKDIDAPTIRKVARRI